MKISDYILSKENYEKYLASMGERRYLIEEIDENGNKIKKEKTYVLTYEEYKKCLWNAILAKTIDIEDAMDAKDKKPTSFIIVAPPGAGKSSLASYEEAEFIKTNNRTLVRLDPDQIGLYHKHYDDIAKEIPQNAFTELQVFIKTALNDTLRPFVHDQKFDTLTEGTFGDTEGYKKIIKDQKKKGYKVIISTIVTPRIERDLSSCERFQDLVDSELPGRLVNLEYSKKVEERYMNTFLQVEQEKLYDEIKVYRRGMDKNSAPILIWKSGDNRYQSVLEAINDEMAKSQKIIIHDKDIFKQRILELRKRIKESSNIETKDIQFQQLEDIEGRLKEMLNENELKSQK